MTSHDAGGILAALCGALFFGGAVLLVAAWRGHLTPDPAVRPRAARWGDSARRVFGGGTQAARGDRTRREQLIRVGVAVAAGVLLWVVTGWPVAGLGAIAILIILPWLFGAESVMQARIDRIEALESWCRRMSDKLSGGGGHGLMQCLIDSAENPPAAIADEVRLLARRLQTQQWDGERPVAWRAERAALQAFADQLDDPAGDQVAAALILAWQLQGSGLSKVLTQLADGIGRQVAAQRAVEAERAEPRQSMRMLLIMQGGILILLALSPDFAEPYGDPPGQLMMGALLSGTVALLVWLRKLQLAHTSPRFLRTRVEP